MDRSEILGIKSTKAIATSDDEGCTLFLYMNKFVFLPMILNSMFNYFLYGSIYAINVHSKSSRFTT